MTYSAISGQPEFLKVTVGVRNAVLTDVHDRLVEAPYTAPLAQSPPSCLSRETDSVNLLFVGFPFRPIPLTAFSTECHPLLPSRSWLEGAGAMLGP